MAPDRDPIARLRLLSGGRAGALGVGRRAPAAAGWVPTWPGDSAIHIGVGSTGGDAPQPALSPAARVVEDAVDDPDHPPVAPEPADSPPRPVRFRRLRDRWVPDSLRTTRVDPGRRGAVLLTLVAAVAAAAAAVGVWTNGAPTAAAQPVSALQPLSSASATPVQPTSDAEPRSILVSVTGSVRSPGLVTLPAGSRVADAVDAAGGMLDGTDFTGLNLAAKLADGDSVVIGGPSAGLQGSGDLPAGSASSPGQLIDLNRADQAELETLPGVGPVMAGNILAWRQSNGPFTNVDQLQEITGIGPARYATLAPLVTVG